MNKLLLIAMTILSTQAFAASAPTQSGLTLVSAYEIKIPANASSVNIVETDEGACDLSFYSASFERTLKVGDKFTVVTTSETKRPFTANDVKAYFQTAMGGIELKGAKNADIPTLLKLAEDQFGISIDASTVPKHILETHIELKSQKTSLRSELLCRHIGVAAALKALSEAGTIKPSTDF